MALDQAGKDFPADWFNTGDLVFEDNQYKAVEDTVALILVTEWKTFPKGGSDPDKFLFLQKILPK